MSNSTIDKLLFGTANRIFSLPLDNQYVEKEYDPSLWSVYGYNPFSRIDGTR